jgi:chromosome partitioning protein
MIITISHQKGGVGKSTIAFNLAIELSKKFETSLIDLDVQKTLTHANNIRFNNDLKALKILDFKNDDDLILFLEKKHDDEIIIIDSGGFDSSLNRVVIIGADIILTPVTDKVFDLLGLQKYEEILEELSLIEKRNIISYVFLNNINPRVKKFDELTKFITKSKNFEILNTILRTRVDFSNSSAEGKSVIEYKPKSKASIEINSFINELLEI